MFWDKEIETMDEKGLKEIQLAKLKKAVDRVREHPFYKERFKGITGDKIKSIEDLKHIPFTTKKDFRDNYPFGMFTVPRKEIVRIHASSGTTGKPTVVGYTRKDLDMWADCMARIITMTGVTPEDVAQVSFGYGLFTGAFGLHGGLEKVGVAVVPTSSGNSEKQIMLMKDFETTVLIGTPSYALYLAEVMEDMGVSKEDIHLRVGLFGAESSTEEMRQELQKRLGLLATENYGMSELIGPGVSGECEYQCGMHINEDHFIPEIINPETGEVLPEGEVGELVITAVSKEALPVFRYRTKDITSLTREPCKCGRTLVRMTKIQGRSDDMLIIKGVNVFPTQIESVIMGIDHISPNYLLVVTKNGFTDALEVRVELTDASLLESFGELEKLNRTIKQKLHTVLGLDVKVSLVEPKSIERSKGKVKRILDLR